VRVAVIGAGPAGLTAARGLDADVFEEHEEVGLPRHCTSLVSSTGAGAVGIPNGLVVRRYRLLTAASLSGRAVYFTLRNPVYLIDRPGLEQKLAEGVEGLKLGEQAVEVRGGYVRTRRGVYGPYDLVVIAEGSARRFSGRLERVVRLPGLQVDARIPGRPVDEMLVIYDKRISDEYFAWVVHIDGDVYRIGLADSGAVPQKLAKLLKALRAEPVGRPFGGGVLAGPPHGRVVGPGYALVGDAAGLTKPLSGGGIVLAMRSGEALNEALRKGEPQLYEGATKALRARLRLAHRAYWLMYRRGLVHKALEIYNGQHFVAVDYDDHLKTLAVAAATTAKSLKALAEALRLLL
jgi:flavin-dependent dehydrogenase